MKISNSRFRIKELIENFGITQAELCERTGLSKSVVSMYINGNREPRQDKISLIADVFNVDPAWLIGYDVPMMRNEQIEKKYSPETVKALSFEGLDANTIAVMSSYAKLTKEQQESVRNLIQSMLPNH